MEEAQGEKNWDGFLEKLTWLSHEYQIGITGDIVLFEMERDDSPRVYRFKNDSKVEFT